MENQNPYEPGCMIILDANVLSALLQQHDQQVLAWLDGQPAEPVWLNSVTLFEVRYGMALLASGQRKNILNEHFEQLMQDDLQNRVLLFDSYAAINAHNWHPTVVHTDGL